jgi:hypothetical protein
MEHLIVIERDLETPKLVLTNEYEDLTSKRFQSFVGWRLFCGMAVVGAGCSRWQAALRADFKIPADDVNVDLSQKRIMLRATARAPRVLFY